VGWFSSGPAQAPSTDSKMTRAHTRAYLSENAARLLSALATTRLTLLRAKLVLPKLPQVRALTAVRDGLVTQRYCQSGNVLTGGAAPLRRVSQAAIRRLD
jgi:hypothetical protein